MIVNAPVSNFSAMSRAGLEQRIDELEQENSELKQEKRWQADLFALPYSVATAEQKLAIATLYPDLHGRSTLEEFPLTSWEAAKRVGMPTETFLEHIAYATEHLKIFSKRLQRYYASDGTVINSQLNLAPMERFSYPRLYESDTPNPERGGKRANAGRPKKGEIRCKKCGSGNVTTYHNVECRDCHHIGTPEIVQHHEPGIQVDCFADEPGNQVDCLVELEEKAEPEINQLDVLPTYVPERQVDLVESTMDNPALDANTVGVVAHGPLLTSILLSDLRALPLWVNWRYDKKTGKKIPLTPGPMLHNALPDDSRTWRTYEQAKHWYEHETRFNRGTIDGIGLNFCGAIIPVMGIDLDHCVDENGNIDVWAQDIINQVASYTEYSPSRSGVHILIIGECFSGERHKITLKGMRHPKAAIEMYSEERYFTFTGKQLPGTPDAIMPRQHERNAVYTQHFPQAMIAKKEASPIPHCVSVPLGMDGDILHQCRSGHYGDDFQRLYNGDMSAYSNDHSVADLALCKMIAWFTNDPECIDRTFSGSRLYRDKWERQGYKDKTIAMAIEYVSIRKQVAS